MNYIKRDNGFTLLEVMAVIIIIGGLAAIAIPRLASSTVSARQKADVATAHEVKSALDRFQVENGAYPIKGTDLTIEDGQVSGTGFIPKYISKLDKSTTQQSVPEANKGFGVATLGENYSIPNPDSVTNLIMIYLSTDGLAAEVRAYDEGLKNVLWSSAN